MIEQIALSASAGAIRRVAPILIAALAAFTTLFATARFGPGITPDSVQYLSGAESFSAGDGLAGIDGSRVAWWAPGYPVLLSIASSAAGVSVVEVSRIINAIAIFLSTMLAWHLLSRVFAAPTAFVLLTVYALGSCQLIVATKMLTEPAFAVLVNLMVGLLGRDRRWKVVLLASIAAALCFLMRYAGAAIVGAAALYILLADERRRDGLLKSVVFGSLAALPGLLWLVRNVQVSGTIAGARPAPESVAHVAASFVAGMSELLFLPGLPRGASMLAGALVLSLVGWAIWKAMVISRDNQVIDDAGGDGNAAGVVRLSATVVGVYVVFILTTSLTGWSSPMSARLLHPILLPAFIVIAAGAAYAGGMAARVLRPVLLALAIVTVLGGGVYALMRHDLGGGGLNTVAWRNSETVQRLRDVPDISRFWSNKPEAVRFFRGVQSYSLTEDDRDQLADGSVVVWFSDGGRNANSYREWVGQQLGWLFPRLLRSPSKEALPVIDCGTVATDLALPEGALLAQAADGCILAAGARSIE